MLDKRENLWRWLGAYKPWIENYGIGEDSAPAKLVEEGGADGKAIDEFFKLISIAHSVIPTDHPTDPENRLYQAASPDELALVEGA